MLKDPPSRKTDVTRGKDKELQLHRLERVIVLAKRIRALSSEEVEVSLSGPSTKMKQALPDQQGWAAARGVVDGGEDGQCGPSTQGILTWGKLVMPQELLKERSP